MGAVIDSVAVSRPRRWRRDGSVALAARAGRECLERAGCDANELGLLVNSGVYRDENICEPAMAPFVQRRVGANPKLPPLGAPSTFSFDLVNGGCGFLSAVQAVDGFLRSGRIERGLVVTSDVNPLPRASEGMSFAPAGAALLLSSGAADAGFTAFHFESFAKHAHLFGTRGWWIGDERPKRRLRFRPEPSHALFMREDERHVTEAADSARQALGRFLHETGLRPDDLDLVLPSQFPAGFPAAFAEAAGLETDRVVDATAEFGAVHTAGLAVALHAAMSQGRFPRARRALFVAVGAGISVQLALYMKK
jgi:3-oxoacyl-[acyl-carrier-protein] synthase-3